MACEERTHQRELFAEKEEPGSISFKTRRKILLALSVIGCSALLVLCVQDSSVPAVVDWDELTASSELFGTETGSPVELEQQSSALETALRRLKKNKGKKYCDHACEVRKKRIKAAIARKMKQLRDQINSDFSSMIDFGHKAGYLPPPKSIKEQVMSGTLLKGDGKTGADAVAPPPFKVDPKLNDPTLAVDSSTDDSDSSQRSSRHQRSQSRDESSGDGRHREDNSDHSSTSSKDQDDGNSRRHSARRAHSSRTKQIKEGRGKESRSRASDDDDSSSGGDSDDSDTSATPRAGRTQLSSTDSSEDSSSSSSSSSSSDSSDSSGSSGGSGSAWAKAFSFMKHTDNPIGGSSTATAKHSHSSHSSDSTGTSFVGVTTFKHVVKGDKFLESFEDPAASAAASPSASRASSSGGGKGKGKDLLKSVETDKFLAGFLGGV